jgi:hypothetical protein
VAGRRSGRALSVPLVIADVQGERYLVSMLGEDVNWVRNLRAAGGAAALRHGGRERVHLEEVPPPERAAVLRTYLGRAPNARVHFPVRLDAPPSDFEGIADRYPVFRVTPRRPVVPSWSPRRIDLEQSEGPTVRSTSGEPSQRSRSRS